MATRTRAVSIDPAAVNHHVAQASSNDADRRPFSQKQHQIRATQQMQLMNLPPPELGRPHLSARPDSSENRCAFDPHRGVNVLCDRG
jgi:hypothetical protein